MTKRYNRVMIVSFIALFILGSFILSQFIWLRYNGKAVPAPIIERNTTQLGNGKQVKYLVMGDSTAAGQGGDYATGLAMSTATHLAQDKNVSLLNTAVSGARAKDIVTNQLNPGIDHDPDVALIIVGSNDVTHLTSSKSVRQSIEQAVSKLIAKNCNVKIVVTGSADMGAVPRLPEPLRYLAGVRAKQLNRTFMDITNQQQITFAPIAEKTGSIFRNDSTLFAQDNFHPNTKGYDVWVPVLNDALDDALSNQPSHCRN
jgi:lysophospholipase L1-like esterase